MDEDKKLWNEASKLSCTIATNYKLLKQIEKMKNCLNCRFEYPLCNECNGCGENYKHWELAE